MSERDELETGSQPNESRGGSQTTHRRDLLKAVGVGAIGLSGLANATGRVSADQIAIEDWNDLRSLRLGQDNTLVADLDIDTPGYEEYIEEPAGGWEPLVNSMVTLNGNGHTISDLVINRPNEDDVGLFGRLEIGGIENLSVRDADITDGGSVGTLIGYGAQCSVVNSDTTGSVSGGGIVGGFIGRAENGAEVRDSHTEQQINPGGGSVGGFIGICARGSVLNSHATEPVDSSGSGKTGGLVGDAFEASIRDSYATGAVSGGDSVGGIVGSIGNGGTVERSYATGAVSGGDSVGGLVGFLGLGGVTNSYAANSVDGEDGVGGLVGSVTDFNDFYDFTHSYGGCQG
ncbi:hypothetical protein [Halorubrum sp. Ea8]|uniref:hypothetical protein n=1 Tax=Halorubrum sp. Ea8 TaxID=1383841 RepID=UPI00113FE1EF|nr:hypothetical protein [Halorubrum sp. Ea8]